MRQAVNAVKQVNAETKAERNAALTIDRAEARAARMEDRARGYGRKPKGRPTADTRAVDRAGRYVVVGKYRMAPLVVNAEGTPLKGGIRLGAYQAPRGSRQSDTLPADFGGSTVDVPAALAERWADGLLLAAGYDVDGSDGRTEGTRALAPETARAVTLAAVAGAARERAHAARAAWLACVREERTGARRAARLARERARDAARRERERALAEQRKADRARPLMSGAAAARASA